jgi:hypothetical protein
MKARVGLFQLERQNVTCIKDGFKFRKTRRTSKRFPKVGIFQLKRQHQMYIRWIYLKKNKKTIRRFCGPC